MLRHAVVRGVEAAELDLVRGGERSDRALDVAKVRAVVETWHVGDYPARRFQQPDQLDRCAHLIALVVEALTLAGARPRCARRIGDEQRDRFRRSPA
jgi:hypothetical protein